MAEVCIHRLMPFQQHPEKSLPGSMQGSLQRTPQITHNGISGTPNTRQSYLQSIPGIFAITTILFRTSTPTSTNATCFEQQGTLKLKTHP